jgi:hypothetical protein
MHLSQMIQKSIPKLTPYQEIIGRLMWISGCTRHDISYSVNFLARSASNPSDFRMGFGMASGWLFDGN